MRIYQYRRQYYILIGKAEEEGGPFRRGRRRREHKDLYSDHLDQYIKQLNPEVLIVYRKRIGGISVNYVWVMDNGIHTAIKLIKREYRYYYEVCESKIQIISKGFMASQGKFYPIEQGSSA